MGRAVSLRAQPCCNASPPVQSQRRSIHRFPSDAVSSAVIDIPLRPDWSVHMSARELEENERKAFDRWMQSVYERSPGMARFAAAASCSALKLNPATSAPELVCAGRTSSQVSRRPAQLFRAQPRSLATGLAAHPRVPPSAADAQWRVARPIPIALPPVASIRAAFVPHLRQWAGSSRTRARNATVPTCRAVCRMPRVMLPDLARARAGRRDRHGAGCA